MFIFNLPFMDKHSINKLYNSWVNIIANNRIKPQRLGSALQKSCTTTTGIKDFPAWWNCIYNIFCNIIF